LRDVLLDEKETGVDPINESRINASSAIDAFEKLNKNEEIGQLVTKIKLANDAYNNAAKEVFELAQQGKIAEGTKVLIEDHREVRADLVNDSQMLTKIEEEQMREALEQSYILYMLAIKVFLAFVVICFVAGLGITILVVKSITNGINRVSSVIATVAENTSEELPRIESVPKNETRDIALAFMKIWRKKKN
jgi:CHASE3 domain sensor protein